MRQKFYDGYKVGMNYIVPGFVTQPLAINWQQIALTRGLIEFYAIWRWCDDWRKTGGFYDKMEVFLNVLIKCVMRSTDEQLL